MISLLQNLMLSFTSPSFQHQLIVLSLVLAEEKALVSRGLVGI